MASRTASLARGLALAALMSSVFVASSAGAQSLADKETARALMDEGDAKRDAKDYKAALAAYEKADAIMHVPTTGLEVARMQAQLGMLLEARETLSRVIRIPAKPNEPAPFTAARKTADQLNEDLAKRVPALQITVTGAEGTPSVTIDGETIPPAVLSVPRKVNPGHHVIVAKAGSAETREEVDVAEKETKAVAIDLTAKPAVADKPAVQTTDEPGGGGGSSTGKALMFGGFGVAVVGIGVGAVTGLMSMSKVDDIKQDCVGDKCLASRAGDIDDAKSLGNISTIAFAAGGVGAAVGIIGLIMSSGSSEAKPTTPGVSRGTPTHARLVRPVLSPSWVGLSGSF